MEKFNYTQSLRNEQLIAVYGPRRSGTNYLAELLLVNTQYVIANFDATPAPRISGNPRSRMLYASNGSKHDLSDRRPEEKYPPDAVHLFVFKPLLSWIFSRVAYHRRRVALPSSEVKGFARKAVQAEYLSMLSALTAHVDGPLKGCAMALINYDELSLASLGRLLDRLGLRYQMPLIDVIAEAAPGGSLGHRFQPKRPEQLVPELELHADLFAICTEALNGGDERVLRFYERIFE